MQSSEKPGEHIVLLHFPQEFLLISSYFTLLRLKHHFVLAPCSQHITRAERLAPENYRVIGQISGVGVAKVDTSQWSLCETR